MGRRGFRVSRRFRGMFRLVLVFNFFFCGLCEYHLIFVFQSHTGHRPFQCSICQQNFSEAATLQQHTRRHTQESERSCIIFFT